VRFIVGVFLIGVAAIVVSGCQKGAVSSQDVKGWAQAHDEKGNPVSDGPSTGR
jgi:hypothetical protein